MNWSSVRDTSGSAAPVEPGRAEIHFPPFRMDLANERLWRGNELIALRPKAFAILRYLLERPGQLIRKGEVLDHLWPGVAVSETLVKTYLRDVRVALGDSAQSPRFIETAHGRGYRFIGRVLTEHEWTRDVIIRRIETAAAAEPRPLPFSAPEMFVGREAELTQLAEVWKRALIGKRQMAFVTGEPGIGKTSLVQAFLQSLGTNGTHVLAWGHCVEQFGAGEAYLPIVEALRRLCRGPHRPALTAILEREAPSWLAHMPTAAADGAPGAPGRSPSPRPEGMLSDLTEAIEAFAEQHPLVLWLEDLHWADHSTLAWISYVLRRSGPARLLLLGTYRPQAVRSEDALFGAEHELLIGARAHCIEVPLLSRAELDAYLGLRFQSDRLAAELSGALHVQTAGNPLFLERTVESWSKSGLLSSADGAWKLAVPLEQALRETPDSVLTMIERETELLDSFERGVLEAASAVGMDFSTASVAAALGVELVRVEQLCARWARHQQFLRSHGDTSWPDGTLATRCEFIHALYRHVVYERLGPARRAQLHARIGERLEVAFGARSPAVAAELAMHFEQGQLYQKAVIYRTAAGDQALRRSACAEAIAHFRRGLELLQWLPAPERQAHELQLLVALGTPLTMTLGHGAAEVERVYARARDLSFEPTTQLFQALMGTGAFYLVRGEYRTAHALSQQFVALARNQQDPGILLEARLLAGMSLIFLGDSAAAVHELEETVSLYVPEHHRSLTVLFMQDPAVCALALSTLPLWILGFADRAQERAQRALALAEQLEQPVALALAHLSLAQLEEFRGDIDSARHHGEIGYAIATEHGFALYRHTIGMLLGLLDPCPPSGCRRAPGADDELDRDGPREPLADAQQHWDALQATGAEFAGARWRCWMAQALAEAGRPRDAASLLALGFSRVQTHGDRWWEPELYRVLGEIVQRAPTVLSIVERHVPEFPCRDAESCFWRALELAQGAQARSFELRAALSLVRRLGVRHTAAVMALRAAYDSVEEGFDTADYRAAAHLLQASR